jgi:hypothetical protein
MPDLTLQNVPQELFDDLRQAAEANHRSVAEEALERLAWAQRRRLPDEAAVTGEMLAPCTLPLPGEGRKAKAVQAGGARLPDPPWVIAELQ